METIKKFVVIGPESTGKSTLCHQLAAHYHTLWVPEYAREFLEIHGTAYTYEDLLSIAKGQLLLEEDLLKKAGFGINHPAIFIDTDMYVMKVWCEFVFNYCHSWILNRIAERQYDGYLLCNTDLAWVADNLREYPDTATRNRLYCYYRDILVNQSAPWVEISGNFEERFEKATVFIDNNCR